MTATFDEYFEIQRERNLRGERLGVPGYVDIEALEGEELRDFIRWNVLAAQVELTEALNEVSWKPWRRYPPEAVFDDREKFVEEVVDVLNFIGNLLLTARVTPDELMDVMRSKDRVIERRQSGTY